MSTLELKAEIHQKIEALNDEAQLLDVKLSLDWILSGEPTGEETAVLQRLREVRQHAEYGTGIPHEEVMNEAKSWLNR